MIEWEVTDDGVRAVDSAKRELVVRAPDWQSGGVPRTISQPVDATATGTVSSFVLPSMFVSILEVDSGESYEIGADRDRLSLDTGTYVLDIDASIKAYVRFDGPATVVRHGDRYEVEVSFPFKRSVTIGFRSFVRAPTETVTVPKTTEGLATALSTFGAAHRTTTPDRTFQTMRRHPPTVEFGEETHVPDSVAEQMPDTGVELVLPDDMQTLFVASPLAFYLSADVHVEAGASPHVRVDELGVRHDFIDPVEQVPELVERLFWLDALVRGSGPHGMTVEESELLERLDIDAEAVYDQSIGERLQTYLNVPYNLVKSELPDWHLAMYVEPSFEHAQSLPFLLNRLSHVYPPETAALEGKELMERSLDDFYREAPGPIASIDMVKPRLRRGRVHGWMADGTPIDVFKTRPAAYENKLSYLGADDDTISVTVVLNDAEMSGEHSRVAEIYRERAEDVPMDLTLVEDLTCDELAELFAQPNDFVHYIGHCEVEGLRCADGNLSISDIDESNAQTFFLNACGSYYEGLDLVEKGSVAGAVTFRKVLDEQAAKVGTAFARMLVNGFSIERAIRLARRRIMMGKDYAVVGDGTQVVTQSDAYIPATLTVERLETGRFEVTYEAGSPWSHGATYQVFAPGEEAFRLCGNETTVELSWDDTCSLLEHVEVPTIYEGEFYWSDEVLSMLREGRIV
ncbi:hypothetical protein [Halarchaeum sp. P4]|uniref:hypothetical protein n=1 Tax=Halarchaeum sp. P4 TaxID=3421639 RepID=UPI003EB6EBB0